MAQTLEDNYKTTFSVKVNPWDLTVSVAVPPTTVTAWRLYIVRWSTQEWMSFTSVSWNTLTWVTRALSKTTWWVGQTWVAWTTVILTIMSDQLLDKLESTSIKQIATTFADTTARDTALWGDGVATESFTDIYVTADWLFYNYNLSSNQWEAVDTGTVTPNGSETVAGKFELSTNAQQWTQTSVWETGARLVVPTDQLAKAFVWGADENKVPILDSEWQISAFIWNKISTKVTAWEDINSWESVSIVQEIGSLLGSHDISAQDSSIVWIRFNGDWTKMFLLGSIWKDVNEYTLSVWFDLNSTINFITNFSVATQATVAPRWLAFNGDWTKMFICGQGAARVFEYTLSIWFDLTSSVVYTWNSLDVSTEDTSPTGIVFNPAWTVLIVAWTTNDTLYQYTLWTWFDITTASYASKSLDISSQSTSPQWISFDNTWSRLYLIWASGGGVFIYKLLTAYDISTASFSYSDGGASTFDITFNATFNKLFMPSASILQCFDYSVKFLKWNALDRFEFVWLCALTTTLWNPLTINISWIDNTQTWLDVWVDYFLSDTNWQITRFPWTNNVKVWRTISATQLLINTWGF